MSAHKSRDWIFVLLFSAAAASLGAPHLEQELTRAGGRPPPCATHPSLVSNSGSSRTIEEREVCRAGAGNSSAVLTLLEELGKPETPWGAPVSELGFREVLRRNGHQPPPPGDLEDIVHHERNQVFTRKERSALEGLLLKAGVEEGAALLSANPESFGQAEARFGVARKDVAAVLVAQAHRPPSGGRTNVSAFNALMARMLFLDEEVSRAVSSGAISRNHPLASARAEAARKAARAGLPALLRYARKAGVDSLQLTGRLPATVGPWGLDPVHLGKLEDGNGDGRARLEDVGDAILTVAAVLADGGYASDRAGSLMGFNLSGYSAKLVVALGDRIGWKAAAGALRPRAASPGVVAAAAAQPPAPPPPPKLTEDESADESSP